MNVDDLLGFLVIDTAARKVVSKATYTLTPDEQAVRSRSHGIAVANDGKEVWSNDVVHNLTFAFDVTVSPPKQIARFAGRAAAVLDRHVEGQQDRLRACPSSDELIAFDVATKKEKGAHPVPEGLAPHAHARRGRAAHRSGDDIAINRVRRRGMIRRAFIGSGLMLVGFGRRWGMGPTRRRRPCGTYRSAARSGFRSTRSQSRGNRRCLRPKRWRPPPRRPRVGECSSAGCCSEKEIQKVFVEIDWKLQDERQPFTPRVVHRTGSLI